MERRLFEDLVESDVVQHKTSQSLTLPVSIAVHAVVLIAVIVIPLLSSAELPEPAAAVKAFFAEPQSAPPPPPPPPPPAPRAQVRQVAPKIESQPDKFTAPLDTPD